MAPGRGKWGKYLKHYNSKWEKDNRCKGESNPTLNLKRAKFPSCDPQDHDVSRFPYLNSLHAGWLAPTSEDDVILGKPEAYCKYCRCHLRAHFSDIISHSKTNKHKSAASAKKPSQKKMNDYGKLPPTPASHVCSYFNFSKQKRHANRILQVPLL